MGALLIAQRCTSEVYDAVALATLTYDDGAPADWGEDSLAAAFVALDVVNAPSGPLGSLGHALNISSVLDTKCDGDVAADLVGQYLAQTPSKKLIAFLGPDCGEAAVSGTNAAAADGGGLTIISAGATADSLGNSTDYPNFVRVAPAAALYDSSVVYTAARFSWFRDAKAGIVYTNDTMGTGSAAAMNATAQALGVQVVVGVSIARNSASADVLESVAMLKKGGAETIFIAAPVPETRSVFSALHNLSWAPLAVLSNEAVGGEMQNDTAAVEGAQGYLTMLPEPYPSAEARSFAAAFTSLTGRAVANAWSTYAHDSVLLLGAALAHVISSNTTVTPGAVGEALRAVTVENGVTGEIYVQSGTNNRAGATRLAILNLQGPNVTSQQDFQVVGEALCDPEAESGHVEAHAWHGEIVWPDYLSSRSVETKY